MFLSVFFYVYLLDDFPKKNIIFKNNYEKGGQIHET